MILSIKTKVHAIGPGVIAGLLKAVDLAESQYRGLVVWSPDDPFSVGADLQAMMPVFMSGGARRSTSKRKRCRTPGCGSGTRRCPVVTAVSGMALGGGCELIVHSAKTVASLESYIGLVEVGVGLIPGAGGLKYGALRAAQAAQAAGMTDVFPFIKKWFLNAAMANVSKSAFEAKQMGYLRADRHDRLQQPRIAVDGDQRGFGDARERVPAAAATARRFRWQAARAWPRSRPSSSTCGTAASSASTTSTWRRALPR